MKKFFLTVSLVALAGMAFGLDIAGVKIDPSVGAYVGVQGVNNSFEGTSGGLTAKFALGSTAVDFGAFVDATYVVASVGAEYQLGKTKQTITMLGVDTTQDNDNQYLNVDFQILGKYPIVLAPVTVFPLVGLDYSLNLNYGNMETFQKRKSRATCTSTLALGSTSPSRASSTFVAKVSLGST